MEGGNHFNNIVEFFSHADLPLKNKDSEVEFTKNSLIAPLKLFLEKVPKLSNKYNIKGDGESQEPTKPIMGMSYLPDISLKIQPENGSYLEKFLAVEVKLLRSGNYNPSISTALGQGIIYKNSGYENVIIFLVDKENKFTPTDINEIKSLFKIYSLYVIVRKISNSKLLSE